MDDFVALADACRSRVRSATGLEVDGVEVLAPGTLPRTSSGKLKRLETRELYLMGKLQDAVLTTTTPNLAKTT